MTFSSYVSLQEVCDACNRPGVCELHGGARRGPWDAA